METRRIPYVAMAFYALSEVVVSTGLWGKVEFRQSTVPISVIPDYNHLPVKVGISAGHGKACLGRVEVESDASWVEPSVDVEAGDLVLAFDTLELFNKGYTATVAASLDGEASQLFVEATIVGLDVQGLWEDPFRPRVYGISSAKEAMGSVVVYDPLEGKPAGSRTLGKMPSGLALSEEGKELLVINSGSRTVSVLEAETMELVETLGLPVFGMEGKTVRSAHIAYGPGRAFYYTDAAANPALHVFDRCPGKVVQSNLIGKLGIGDFALTRDKARLVAWSQQGWLGGLHNTKMAVFNVRADGRLDTTVGHEPGDKDVFRHAARDSRTLVAPDGKTATAHRYVFPLDLPSNGKARYPDPILAMSGNGKFAVSEKALYETLEGRKLADLPVAVKSPVFFNALARLVYFEPKKGGMAFLDVGNLLRPSLVGLGMQPEDGVVCLPPEKLGWEPIHWAEGYEVYFGKSAEAVATALKSSREYLGVTTEMHWPLSPAPEPGARYFWRRDVVTKAGTLKGKVQRFFASKIALDPMHVEVACLSGYRGIEARVGLESAKPGHSWTAISQAPWIQFKKKKGETPQELVMVFDATGLETGEHQGVILLDVGGRNPLEIPVKFTVTPLTLTQLESDLDSPLVYGVTEARPKDKSPSRAYLLEINSATGKINRVLPVGSEVSDLAIHHKEGRIYLPNWKKGELLEVDMETFEIARSHWFSPFKGVGYSRSDVYKVSAGRTGRLVLEAADQWVDMCIFDTRKEKIVGKTSVRQGGGVFPAPGRYYYHGDSNISNAALHKYDTVGDVFKKVASARSKASGYHGARTVVASRDGSKIFWNGSMFDSSLKDIWPIGDEIHSVSPDGQLAFGTKQVYDTIKREPVLAMPTKPRPCTYNPVTQKLVVQEGGKVGFYKIELPIHLVAPTLRMESKDHQSISLAWEDQTLESGHTLQHRKAGDKDWSDLAKLKANVTTYTAKRLAPGSKHEFRIKVATRKVSSGWGDTLQVQTRPPPPRAPVLSGSYIAGKGMQVGWKPVPHAKGYLLERAQGLRGKFEFLAKPAQGSTSFLDPNVALGELYTYRLKAFNASGESNWGTGRRSHVPKAPPPKPEPPEFIISNGNSGKSIKVYWANCKDVEKYILERREGETGEWKALATVPAKLNYHNDHSATPGTAYAYRIKAVGKAGESAYSEETVSTRKE